MREGASGALGAFLDRQTQQRNHMARKVKSKEYTPKRVFSMRSDASVRRAQREVERVFGLPEGSVLLVLPSGRRARADKTIGALIDDWNG